MTLKIGIAGTGWFGKMHAEKLSAMEGVQISAFCGTSSEKAEAAASPYRDARGYESIEQMLDDRKLDAVYVCTPPFAHGEIELALVERGIPFLVEKPIGVDEDTPNRIRNAINEKGLVTSVGYHFRYMDSTSRAKDLLAVRKPLMALGQWMGSMPGVYWWRHMNTSGGQFVEQTTHIVDLMRYLLGDVNEVYAAYGYMNKAEQDEDVTVPNIGSVTMKLASGAVATISNTCGIQGGHHAGLQIYTDAGVLDIAGDALIDKEVSKTTKYQSSSNPYIRENEAFLHAIRTGDRSGILSTYDDAWHTHQVTMAANKSAMTGLPVKLRK
ncbi:Gfo/Idh/MocA family protein [Paenibacillus sp. GXUN7292]|uniref:Gfo/Idh/MocA family protein n=2 Tax=unclassified Paenibacillus TaxID=185978 RepID=UPI003D7EA2AF